MCVESTEGLSEWKCYNWKALIGWRVKIEFIFGKGKTKEKNLTLTILWGRILPIWSLPELQGRCCLPWRRLQMQFEAPCAEVSCLSLLYFINNNATMEIGSSEHSPGWRLRCFFETILSSNQCVPSYRDREENFLLSLYPLLCEK